MSPPVSCPPHWAALVSLQILETRRGQEIQAQDSGEEENAEPRVQRGGLKIKAITLVSV